MAISKKLFIKKNKLEKEKSHKNNNSLTLKEIVRQKRKEKKLKIKQEKLLLKEKLRQQKKAKKKINRHEKDNNQLQNKKPPTANLARQKRKIERQEKKKAIKAKRHERRNSFARKLKTILQRIIDFLKRTSVSIISLTTFVACLTNMVVINLKYNFGETSLLCVLAYALSFVTGAKLVKLLANFVICLYNKRKRNINEKD